MASNKAVRFSHRVAAVLFVFGGIRAAAQPSFDTSANANLHGAYFVRELFLSGIDATTGAIGRAVSLTGTMIFDGAGSYSFTGQMMDSKIGELSAVNGLTGSYGLAANGLAYVQDVVDSTQFNFGEAVPDGILASATEGPDRSLFVAIPAANALNNSSLKGSYHAAFIDFLQGNASLVRDGYFMLSTSGDGNFGNVTVTGAMANQGSQNTTQSLTGVTYNITNSNGTGTLNFPPLPSLSTLVTGQKTLYVSSDGILLAGDPSGFDIIIAIPSLSGTATNSLFQGTYFTAGLETKDAFSGSLFSLGDGTAISHERYAAFSSLNAIDNTSAQACNLTPSGTFTQGSLLAMLGASGTAFIQVGTGSDYSLSAGFEASDAAGPTVFLDPLKIWNAASFAPITNSVAPGEFVSLFGTGLAPSAMQASSLPLPTILNGVQVMVSGVAAPISYVGPNQINILVPYATSGGFATLQVNNNGTLSSTVTLYQEPTAPGVFTSSAGFDPGVGPAAALHADYSPVTQDSPAKVGETLQLYMTGLGSVTPAVADGAAALASPLSTVDADIGVFVDGQPATVVFKGLAPGFAGLYQVNFVVPSGVSSGKLVNLGVSTPNAFTMEAKLFIQ